MLYSFHRYWKKIQDMKIKNLLGFVNGLVRNVIYVVILVFLLVACLRWLKWRKFYARWQW